jgi:biotin carboxyl carrier protein
VSEVSEVSEVSAAGESESPIQIRVGDLVGWAGATEIRSSFAGSLEGIIVLPGERVVSGQPVAWLRVETGHGHEPGTRSGPG